MSQQPLFVYVPQVFTRPVSEATPAEERVETAGIAVGSQTILPDLIDKIWHEVFQSLSENQVRRFNGRLERALILAKKGLVQVTAAYRQIYEVGVWDRAETVPCSGQSGHPLSDHYDDQITLFREGAYHKMPWSREAVEQETVYRLALQP